MTGLGPTESRSHPPQGLRAGPRRDVTAPRPMRPRGPRALLRNKGNPELERIPLAGRLPRPALLQRPAGHRPGQGSQRGASASSARPRPRGPRSCVLASPRPTRRAPACWSGPSLGPQPCPAPRARPSDGPGSQAQAGPRSLDARRPPTHPPRVTLGRGGPGTPRRPSPPAASKPTGAALLGREAGERRKGPAPGKLPRRSLSWGCCAALNGARGLSDRPRDRQTADSPSSPRVLPLRVPARGPPAPGPGRSRSPCARAPGAPARCSRLRLGLWLPRPRAERGPTGTVGTAGGGAARGPDHPGGGRPWPARSARLGPAALPFLPPRAPPRPRSAPAARLAAPGGRGRGAEQGACLRGRLRAAPRAAPPPTLGGAAGGRPFVSSGCCPSRTCPPTEGSASWDAWTTPPPLAAVWGRSTLPTPPLNLLGTTQARSQDSLG